MKEMAAAGSQQGVCVGEREGSEGLVDGEEGTPTSYNGHLQSGV